MYVNMINLDTPILAFCAYPFINLGIQIQQGDIVGNSASNKKFFHTRKTYCVPFKAGVMISSLCLGFSDGCGLAVCITLEQPVTERERFNLSLIFLLEILINRTEQTKVYQTVLFRSFNPNSTVINEQTEVYNTVLFILIIIQMHSTV